MKRRMLLLIVLALVLSALVLPAAAQGAVFWTGEYFNNADLISAPVFVLTEASPSHDWAGGSPSPSIQADFFSARWTSVQTVAAGTYQLTVRADDGVRVFINGVAYINEWRPSPGNLYTVSVNLPAGQYTFVVEYYEATGNAFLQYTFALVGGGGVPGGATATVITPLLNVRSIPNPFTGAVLTRIASGQVYAIVGRNADSSWLQLNVNGVIGWVNARYVSAVNLQSVPITDGGNRPTQATVTVTTGRLNVRHLPNPFTGIILTRISRGETYPVLGRNTAGTWLQLNVNGTIGWVNARYVSAVNLQFIPVTG